MTTSFIQERESRNTSGHQSLGNNVRPPRGGAVGDSAVIADCGRAIMHRENSVIIPAIARFVPEHEQKNYNDKVIRALGILDSRVHLVGHARSRLGIERSEGDAAVSARHTIDTAANDSAMEAEAVRAALANSNTSIQ